ncbi:MAG TPA: flotillin-like FloA family protein, partial [Gemmataceae bacterium]|nr:flotillin-like FloA family protein [Gemmataceae bacterium]
MLHVLLAAGKSDNWAAENWPYIAGAIGLIIFLIFLLIFFSFVKLWIQSLLAGAKIGILDMIRMKLLNIDYAVVVRQKIALVQAGVKV